MTNTNIRTLLKDIQKLNKSITKARPMLAGIHYTDNQAVYTDSIFLMRYTTQHPYAPNTTVSLVDDSVLEGNYPQVERLFYEPDNSQALTFPAYQLEAFAKLSIDLNKTDKLNHAQITFTKDHAHLNNKGIQFRYALENSADSDLSVTFNAQYIHTVAKHAQKISNQAKKDVLVTIIPNGLRPAYIQIDNLTDIEMILCPIYTR